MGVGSDRQRPPRAAHNAATAEPHRPRERWRIALSASKPDRPPYILQFALGFVYLHFGLLKFFPDLSPAEMLATQTIIRLSWGWLDASMALQLLALFECAIGIGLLFDVAPRWLPWIFFAHMVGTAAPLFLLPELTFKIAPFAPTLEGQYILKNLVFIAAGWVVLAPRIEFGTRWTARVRAWISSPSRITSVAPVEPATRSRS